MKKIILYSLFFIFLLLSCKKDFFDLTYKPEKTWNTIDELEMAAVATYNFAFYDYDGGSWKDPIFQERLNDFILSDLCHFLGNTEAYPHEVYLNRETSTYIDHLEESFNILYKIIGSANAVMDFYYDNNEDPFPDLSTTDKNENVKRIVGEMHFMRAFAYFLLVKRHSPNYYDPAASTLEILTYRNSFPNTNDEALIVEKATTYKIYDLILDDLKKAKELLPAKFSQGLHHPSYRIGRTNKYVASALLSKVYFQMGKFTESLDEINFVINNGGYALEKNPIDCFNKDFIAESKEVLWFALYSDPKFYDWNQKSITTKRPTQMTKTHYTSINGGRDSANFSLCPWVQFSLSYSAIAQTNWMLDPLNGNFKQTDTARWDKRYNQIYWRMEGYTPNKRKDPTRWFKDKARYESIKNPVLLGDKYYRGNTGEKTNIPMIRLSELYLTRAIISFKNGDLSGAANDINIIRERSWDKDSAGIDFSASPLYVTASNITEKMIHAERIKELAFEADWISYLQALKMDIGAGDRDATYKNRIISYPYTNFYWDISLYKETNFLNTLSKTN